MAQTTDPTVCAELSGESPALEAVRLTDGRTIPLARLFLASNTAPSCDLAEQLGCAVETERTGSYFQIDAQQATMVPGVFAAGDLGHERISGSPHCTRQDMRLSRIGWVEVRSVSILPDGQTGGFWNLIKLPDRICRLTCAVLRQYHLDCF